MADRKGMRVLITGGLGNLAKKLAIQLREEGHHITVHDIVAPSRDEEEWWDRCFQSDICDNERFLNALDEKTDIVIHNAALLSGDCMRDPEKARRVNYDASAAVFDSTWKTNPKATVFLPSSLATFGGLPTVDDYDPQTPGNVYGSTKVAAENWGKMRSRQEDVDFRCLRLPTIISPDAPDGAASNYPSRAFVEAARSGSYTFPVSGSTKMSSAFIADIIPAIVRFVTCDRDDLGGQTSFNLHGLTTSAEDIAHAVKLPEIFPEAELHVEVDSDIQRMLSDWPDTMHDDAARERFGWAPEFTDVETIGKEMKSRISMSTEG